MHLLFDCVFILCLGLIGLYDAKNKRIPDKLLLLLMVPLSCIMAVDPRTDLLDSAAGFFVISTCLLIMTLIVPGSFGGGDIKLMAAAGALLGVRSIIDSFIIAVMLAGIYILILYMTGNIKRKDRIAFGPFLCTGISFIYLYGDRINHFL